VKISSPRFRHPPFLKRPDRRRRCGLSAIKLAQASPVGEPFDLAPNGFLGPEA
jgi:hypothetical protein